MMALCEQCGSIRIVRAQPTSADRLVTILTGNSPFLCRRCGWRGRRKWTDKDLRKLLDYGAGGAEADPTLEVLDAALGQKHQSGHGKNEPSAEAFDFGTLKLPDDNQLAAESSPWPAKEHTRTDVPRKRHRRRTRKGASRQLIAAALAAAAFITLIIVFLTLARG
jgi:hypothetical protein